MWVIVPCYNEGKRLPVETFEQYFSQRHDNLHFLFVNDGSTDNTQVVLDNLCNSFLETSHSLNLAKNNGKAEAIRSGMQHIIKENFNADYVGFIDADLATPLDEIERALNAIQDFGSPSMIIGSRIKLFGTTEISRSNSRHYIGRIIATLISKTLKLAIYDTQCGFKFIRKDQIEILFKDPFISRWLFDVELIFRLLKLVGYDKINGELFELPVTRWEEKGGSKIPISYVFRIPFELLKIRKRYKL